MYVRVIMGIVTFYVFFGTACWMAFGGEVQTVMTTSLPPGQLATTVQLAYSLAVVLTFPLQNFPSLEILASLASRAGARRALGSGKLDAHQRSALSTLVVLALAAVAALAMSRLDRVVSLMGSVLGCPLAFVVPPLMQNRLPSGQHIGGWRRRGNVVVAVLGVTAMISSSVTTILKWK